MKTNLTYDEVNGCAVLKWDESISPKDKNSIGVRLGTFCREKSIKKILIDSREYQRNEDTGELMEYGESFVNSCLRKCRVALLREEGNSGMELVATVAINRGMVMRDFTDEEQAMEWLAH